MSGRPNRAAVTNNEQGERSPVSLDDDAARTKSIDDFLRELFDRVPKPTEHIQWYIHTATLDRTNNDFFSQKSWAWPDDADAIADWAIKQSSTVDVYVCPAASTTRLRRKAEGQWMAGSLWCDIDRDIPAAELEPIIAAGGMIVRSGTEGHAHLYVRLSKPLYGDDIDTANKLLCDQFAGDDKWSRESLLRLPGTTNHKGGQR